jgi:hypothetical protein
MNFLGFGATLKQTSIGGAPGVPVEWAWCLRLDWVAPWVFIEGEDMMGLPKRWEYSHWFYFGPWTTHRKSLCSTIYQVLSQI